MEITANALQNVAVGSNILFTETPIAGSCSMIHREGSGLVTLRGITSQSRARFRVLFNANIAIPSGATVSAATASVAAIALDGEAVGSATMISTTSAAAEFNNISASLFIDVPSGCCQTLSVKNIGSQELSVENANLIIERVA